MPDSLVSAIGTVLYGIGISFAAAIFIYVCTRLVTAAFYRSRKQFK